VSPFLLHLFGNASRKGTTVPTHTEFLNKEDVLSLIDIFEEFRLTEYFLEWITNFSKEMLFTQQPDNPIRFKQRA